MDQSVEQTQDTGTLDSSPESSSQVSSHASNTPAEQTSQSQLADLEKLAKFRFEGREMTTAELKNMILRNKDYTQKTQTLAQERKALEEERKFAENVYYDLQKVAKNPALASEFMKTYPEKYHAHLREILQEQNQTPQAQAQPQQGIKPDFEVLSRLQKMENFFQEQQVSRFTTEISTQMDTLAKKYPDAVPEMALAKVYDAHAKGEKVTPALWERAFKENTDEMNKYYQARYKTMVSKQTTANKKAADVGAGGGTVGRAPEKFTSLKDVTNFAANQLSRKG